MNTPPNTHIKSFNQEIDAVILRHPMIGVKHFIAIGLDLYAVISVPPGNILEFQADFYLKRKAGELAHDLLKKGWTLEFANMNVLQRHVIQIVESNDIQLIHILDAYVSKRIIQLYATFPSSKETRDLDKLINLQTLLQQREKLRARLLNVFHYTGAAPIEK